MKKFIAQSLGCGGWYKLGTFEKLKHAFDCTARNWKKSGDKLKCRVIDATEKQIHYFKNKEVKIRAMTEREIKDYL